MLLPVFERFAEFGWQPFVEPAETFEFFSVSGVFRRANVDASLHGGHSGAQHLIQRSALFDVCLKSGLTHLVVSYIRAEEAQSQPEGAFAGVKNYVLKEPIAVQQWARRRLEAIEQGVNEMISEQQYSGRESPRDAQLEAVEEELRQLNGLRMILIALTERLKEGSRQAAYSSNGVDADGNGLNDTELMRLTTAGIQNLLQLLARTQSVTCACNCMLWLNENEITADSEMYNAFYSQARSLRVTYREQFEEIYGNKLSSVGGLKEPMLLIEHVMKSANISLENLGGSCPPTQLGQLLELLRTPTIQKDVVQFYGDEVDREPIEGYFRVQVALLLYFCLDRAYLSVWKQHTQSGARIANKMRSLADSLAAQLNVRDDMKLTLLALWLVENAVVVKTSGDDQVAIYEHAIGLLQQSSAMHLHQKYDLEADLILHLLETLVHRGESLVAWKVWNTFGVELEQSPPAATELVVVISLELDLWERALSLIRSQKRSDLLDLLFNWLMKSHRLKELVQGVTLLPAEEKLFHTYMMESNIVEDEDVLRDESIKRVDFLVMYYILRNKYEQAWDVHHEHLALIRAMSRGDTEIAMAALNQPSLRIRASLLSNMCAEPPAKSYPHKSRNVRSGDPHRHAKPAVLENEEMEDASDHETPTSPAPTQDKPSTTDIHSEEKEMASTASAFVSAQTEHLTHFQEMAEAGEFDYSPGIFSTRQGSSVTTRSVESPAPLVADVKTPTPTKGKGKGKASATDISIGSIDSSPDSSLHALTRPNPVETSTTSRGIARQALNFGSSPAKPSSAPSTPLQPLVSPLGDRRPLGTPPVRSKINPTFAATSLTPPKAAGSPDDFSLKPHNTESMTDDSSPVESQEQEASTTTSSENRAVQQATTPPPESTDNSAVLETPKRYQFVREPLTDSRLEVAHSDSDHPMSPATEELEEGMELERIDEEFSTPISRSRERRKEPASVPVRRNPRRSARHVY
ncbi:hypothetical protein L917_03868 [Phytophthora nicotianae]|uniref:ELYS-like domain-containing protein n=1 Tax=Phytophthora nicotianae TaxID=4792 RepID=W2LP22_PHYNI|nr:hypothetical protein L917_03868 [Phytophthora nicotianae]